ncbi:unnamed protein product, partial [Didymodactylos carnosus]
MCKYLLSINGMEALLQKCNNKGQTPIHVAIEAIPMDIMGQKSKSHEKDKENIDIETGFRLSILKTIWGEQGNENIKKAFAHGDGNRRNCLHLAAAKGNSFSILDQIYHSNIIGYQEIVKFLFEKVGLEIDAISDRRLTPLHLACFSGHTDTIKYLIKHGASPTLRNAALYNSLEIAIMKQQKEAVKMLLSQPNWRQMMRNAQRIKGTEGYDTPMRKLIRYIPDVAIWMIERNLTRSIGEQGSNVYKKVYDYEFYLDALMVKRWCTTGVELADDESLTERCKRRGWGSLCCCDMCYCTKSNHENPSLVAYTNDSYTLIRNHPLFIAGAQLQCPELVQHPYNIFLRDL